MGNFKKVDLMSDRKGRVDLSETELDIVVGSGKTSSNYLLFNKAITDAVWAKGFTKLNVYSDEDNKTVAFQFSKVGDLSVIKSDKKGAGNLRLTHKKLLEFLCNFFNILPGDTGHHKLTVTGNKANATDCLMYYVRKSFMEQVNFK